MFWYLITVGDKLHSFRFQTEPRRSPRHAENAMALEENTFRDLEADKNIGIAWEPRQKCRFLHEPYTKSCRAEMGFASLLGSCSAVERTKHWGCGLGAQGTLHFGEPQSSGCLARPIEGERKRCLQLC